MNYSSTTEWIIMTYPPGAGGKFLSSCFMQFDNTAFWGGNGFSKSERIDYVLNTWPASKDESWVYNDMCQPWGLNFFSRSHLRNNNISVDEFNQLALDAVTPYFIESQKDKFVLDYWHKPHLPIFWKDAIQPTIIIDDWNLYKKLLFTKPYAYEKNTGTIISLLDTPMKGDNHLNNNANVALFNNQYRFDNTTVDRFFEEHIRTSSWFAGWENTPNTQYSINLSDLFDFDKLVKYLTQFEDVFAEEVSRSHIKRLHNEWVTRTTLFLSNL